MAKRRFLGIVVDPANVQSEGLEQVFDHLQAVETDAIGLWPWLVEPVEAGEGTRIPDLHIDGYKRLLSRPLWGRRELYVRSFLAYDPDPGLYIDSPYQPPPAAPAGLDRKIPHRMVEEAHLRGMQVHLGICPIIPSKLPSEDRPVRIDGIPVQPPYVANSACLNNAKGQHYALASIEDMLRNFPMADGLILDWVEFGAYRLEDHFTCFCEHCEREAKAAGIDWELVRRDVAALWDWLHKLTPQSIRRSVRTLENPSELVEQLTHYPGWLHFLKFKAESVVGFYKQVRRLMDGIGFQAEGLSARGWCPPWNRSSGMDYRALAGVCDAVAPKLFTFDHAAMPRWYGETLLAWNPTLSESRILDALIAWMNLPDNFEHRSLAHYAIPAPAEEHPAKLEVYQTRLEEVVDQVDGRARCYPISHSYLPASQWKRMVTLIRDCPVDGMWVNMYGYLSEDKFRILEQIWS
jgi:hypothetical protein